MRVCQRSSQACYAKCHLNTAAYCRDEIKLSQRKEY